VGAEASLTQLLDRWRRSRSPALADEIERIELLPPFLGSLRSRRINELRERLEALGRRKPDPRVARALVELVRDAPYTSRSSRPMWDDVFELIVAIGDPRAHVWLDGVMAGANILEVQRKWLARRAAATRAKIPAPSEDVKPLARPQRPEDLLAAVYANPDDDAPRMVLADALIERGDPVGELIALQLRGKKASWKPHAKRWLGDLHRFVYADFVMRRGFLAEATLRIRTTEEQVRARDLPGWATLEKIQLGYAQTSCVPRTCRVLREIRGLGTMGVRSLVALPHLRPLVLELDWRDPIDLLTWRSLDESPVVDRVVRLITPPIEHLPGSRILGWLDEIESLDFGDPHVQLGASWPRGCLTTRSHLGGFTLRGRDLVYRPIAAVMEEPNPGWNDLPRACSTTIRSLRTDGPTPNAWVTRMLERFVARAQALVEWDLTSVGGERSG
jgi:uncharacterized protein (TIGR02996 family)